MSSEVSLTPPVTPGTQIPGVGTVRRIRNLVPLHHRLLGKHHTTSTIHLLTTTDGRRFKLVTHPGATGPGARTRIAADRLAAVTRDGAVPRVHFVDDRHLVLSYISGAVLHTLAPTADRIGALARFIAQSQPDLPPAPPPDWAAWIERLSSADVLTPELADRIRGALPRFAAAADLPRAICFADGALKNFVETAPGCFCYVDAFGLNPDYVGLVFIRQVLSVPASARTTFVSAYLDASPHPDALRHLLPEYCIAHLLERVVARASVVTAGRSPHHTRARHRQWTRAFATSLNRLVACLDLPPDPDAHLRWLTDPTDHGRTM